MRALLKILLTVLVALLTSTGLWAQDEKLSHRKILFPDETHHFYVLNHTSTVPLQNTVVYHWFKNNAVHRTQGGYDGMLIDGPYVIYYANNDLKEKGVFSKGRKDALWRAWYPNGMLREITSWKKGLQDGDVQVFDNSGKLLMTGSYSKGLMHGTFTYFDEDTIPKKEKYVRGKLKVPKIKTPEPDEKKKGWRSLFHKKNKIKEPAEPKEPKIKKTREEKKAEREAAKDKKELKKKGTEDNASY